MANRTQSKQETRLSLVPAPVAGLLSLLVPGLGQALARHVYRGVLLLVSLGSIVGLLAWRVQLLAHREEGPLAMLVKALQRRPSFVVAMLLGVVALWLFIAWDAYRLARPGRRSAPGVFVLVFLLLFVLGWQITEIDVYKAVNELADVWPRLSQILWPWEAAFDEITEVVSAGADIQVPCTANPPPPPEEIPGQPYVAAEPTCGVLSEQDENYASILGTVLTFTGRGFAPNTEVEIWWIDPLGNEFRVRQEGSYVAAETDDQGAFEIEVIMPYRLIPTTGERAQMHRIEARQVSQVVGVQPSEALRLIIERMIETIMVGMMATLFGIVLSIPISLMAARNLMSGSWVTMALYYLVRTWMNIVRSIEPIIWALIAVVWVGLGPFAGFIALTLHSIAALGKLYSEAIESIDPGPIEAIQATGATRLQMIAYAVVPQMIPPFVSFSIYRWDINIRMSTILGLVGGGGIGFLLIQYIRLLDYRAAGIAVWFITITVAIMDYVSAEIRQHFV